MGLLTRGLLSISVFKVKTKEGLAGIAKAASESRYPAAAEEPSTGWGSLADEEVFAAPTGVQLKTYKGFKPAVLTNHNATKTLGLRYYYDQVDPSLVKRFGSSADWRTISNRFAFDILLLDEDEPDQLTALVSTRKQDEITNHVWPALTELVSGEVPPGSLSSASITEEFDPDFFLWLLYMLNENTRIAPNVKLSAILDLNGVFVGRRSSMSQGVDMTRDDLLALVARDRASLGPAKIAIVHYAEPEGYFEIQIHRDGGFQVYRNSKYEDSELKKLSIAVSGQRMVQDVWETILPVIRTQYQDDTAWRQTRRPQFVAWARDELLRLLSGAPGT